MIVLMGLWRFATCLALVALSGTQALDLFENVSLAGGWTVYPIRGIVLENTTVRIACQRNDSVFPDYTLLSPGHSVYSDVVARFKDTPLLQRDDTIKIDKFAQKYEGLWRCTAKVRLPGGIREPIFGPSVAIELAVAPTITQFVAPNTNLSDPVTITCGSPEAKPVPSYMAVVLEKDGTVLKNESGRANVSHTIAEVTKDDAGRYTCVAENKAGRRSRTEYFVVQYVPVTTILNMNVTINQTENITFSCQSNGVPDAAITWLLEGKVVKTSDKVNSTLMITSATKEDSGTYTCQGRNDAGFHSDEVVLQVRAPPEAPEKPYAQNTTNVSITVAWIAGSDNFSPIKGYEVRYRERGSDIWLYARNFSDAAGATTVQLIEGLRPLTDYEFRVRARNAFGEGDYSEIGTLTTHPNAPSVGPTILTFTNAKPQTVDLSWTLANQSLLADNEGNITYYEMAYNVKDKPDMASQNTNGVVSMDTLDNLAKGTDYVVRVYARNSGPYRSPPSNEQSFTTGKTVPGRVSDLQVTNESEYSLTITWKVPQDTGGAAITGYNVEHRTSTGAFKAESQASVNASFPNLQPDTLYTFRVSAINSVGPGLPVTKEGSTLKTAVTIDVNEVTETTIDLKFTPTTAETIDRFGIEWKRDDPSDAASESRVLQADDRSFKIEELNTQTNYRITIVTHFSDGTKSPTVIILSTERLLSIRTDPETTLIVTAGEVSTASCLTRMGAEPPGTDVWYRDDEVVSNGEYITVNQHKLTVTYSEQLNGAVFQCKVNGLTASLEIQLVEAAESTGLSNGAKAGIAVGVIILVVIVVLLIVFCIMTKRSRGRFKPNSGPEAGSKSEKPPPAGARSSAYEMKGEDDPRYAASDPVAPESASDMEKIPPSDDAFSPPPPVTDEPAPGEMNNDEHGHVTLKDQADDSEDYENAIDGSGNSKQTTV